MDHYPKLNSLLGGSMPDPIAASLFRTRTLFELFDLPCFCAHKMFSMNYKITLYPTKRWAIVKKGQEMFDKKTKEDMISQYDRKRTKKN